MIEAKLQVDGEDTNHGKNEATGKKMWEFKETHKHSYDKTNIKTSCGSFKYPSLWGPFSLR